MADPGKADYKSALYEHYVSTHTGHRDGLLTPELLAGFVPTWRATVAPFLPAGRASHIIDVGCGDGRLLWWLQRQGYSAEGIDISAEQVAEALRLGVRDVQQADLLVYLEARPATFDMIIMRDVLEHFPRPEILEILRRCRSALRPGGQLLIQVPNAESPLFGRIRYGDFTHELAFTETSLRQIFQMTGFTSVTCVGIPPIATTPASRLRLLLWRVLESLYRFALYLELGRGRRIVTQNLVAVAKRSV